MFRQIKMHIDRVAARASAPRAEVQASVTGGALGAPPAIGAAIAGGGPWAGADGFAHGRGVTRELQAENAAQYRPLPPKKPPAIILPDIVAGNFPISYDTTLYWDAERPVIDQLAGRHTRTPIEGWASRMAYGSSDVASGPEGTLVLFPPRMPRALSTGRSVNGAKRGNVLLNYAADHVQTPNVPVVSAAYGRTSP